MIIRLWAATLPLERLECVSYGVIASEVIIGGNNEIGRNVSFTYALNPDWTRNIEFDPAKVAVASR